MSCAMIYWGHRTAVFSQVFNAFGAVVDLSSLQGKQIGVNRPPVQVWPDVRERLPTIQSELTTVQATRDAGIGLNVKS